MKVAVVGATGMVGRVMLKVLQERQFPVTELIPVASEKSVGEKVDFKGKQYTVVGPLQAVALKPQLALFSAGAEVSKVWAPKFAQVGTRVVDNSSAWRMDPTKKLIIPEINPQKIEETDMIIANPNCSTIQMLVALYPIEKKYGIKRIIVSTYQSITGTGVKAVRQLENEYKAIEGEMAYHYPIHKNAIPQCDVFEENGYTKEEMKLCRETKKIFEREDIKITATAVRIPVVGGHSESINVETIKDFDIEDIRTLMKNSQGVTLQDCPQTNTYPMPIYAEGADDVFVGRLRVDESAERSLNMWVVSDNLRKGAATNTIQIAEELIKKGFIK